MLATIRDDTWNLLNMQHITPNPKKMGLFRQPHSSGHEKIKDPPTWLKVATTLEKPQPPPTYSVMTKLLLS